MSAFLQGQKPELLHHQKFFENGTAERAKESGTEQNYNMIDAGEWEKLYGSQSDADMAMLSILAFWCGCDEEQMDRIFRTTGLMHDKWDRKQAGTTYGAISIRNAVNSCAAVYTPVNAQDIVDEEFSKLDEDDYIEFQPDLSKITVTLEEMAPHTNARYGRNEIGMGNMFADYGRNTVRIALAAKKLRNVRTINISQLAPDLGNLHLFNADVCIDVGINYDENGKQHGDCADAVYDMKDIKVTPRIGGVGLMTRAMLLYNVCVARYGAEKMEGVIG